MDRLNQRTIGAEWPQAQIDAKDEAILGDLSHRLNNLLADFGKESAWIGFSFGSAAAFAFIVFVEKNDVDIGAEIEFVRRPVCPCPV